MTVEGYGQLILIPSEFVDSDTLEMDVDVGGIHKRVAL
jgi:hypothetical protein